MKPASVEKTKKSYLNKSQELANLIHPKNYFGVIGRGSGKSQRILAIRTSRLAFEMPGADFGWYGNSYINLQTNLIPNVIKGWRELGYLEGIDYVIDVKPPASFKDGKTIPLEWKHVITWCNGSKFYLISDDRPQNANGRSIQHFFGDEIKLVNYQKMSRSAFPAIRGERIAFGNIPQFQGFTFTTDMPDPETGQWLFDMMAQADEKQIQRILQTALMESNIINKMLDLPEDDPQIKVLNDELVAIRLLLNRIRKNSTYAVIASTLVNIDALGLDYLENQLISLGWRGFKSSILSILVPSADVLFYARFSSKHLLPPRNHFKYTDSIGLISSVKRDSRSDGWTNPDKELIAGLDFGNMNGLVLNQKFGREFRTIKNIHVLQPEIIDDLAVEFCEYYRHHRKKVLKIHYDRAGNNRMPNNKTTVIKQFKEKILSRKEGWVVSLNSLSMKIIPHEDRKLLIDKIHTEDDPNLPIHRIDESNCPELTNSMRNAPYLTAEKKKDKKSEKKRNLSELPFNSTNYSDALDYALWGEYSKVFNNTDFSQLGPSYNK